MTSCYNVCYTLFCRYFRKIVHKYWVAFVLYMWGFLYTFARSNDSTGPALMIQDVLF